MLSGSTSLALQGVNVKVNDIDILANENEAIKLDEILKEYRIKELEYSSTDKYRSLYGKYKIDNVDIDIMANFQYKLKNGNWSDLIDLNIANSIEYQGIKILV